MTHVINSRQGLLKINLLFPRVAQLRGVAFLKVAYGRAVFKSYTTLTSHFPPSTDLLLTHETKMEQLIRFFACAAACSRHYGFYSQTRRRYPFPNTQIRPRTIGFGGILLLSTGTLIDQYSDKRGYQKKYSTLKLNRDNRIEIPDGSLPKNEGMHAKTTTDY